MLLALDIGNSTIVAASFDGQKELAKVTTSSRVQRSSDEAWAIIQSLIHQSNPSTERIHGVGISSVVPFLTTLFTQLCKEKLSIEPVIVGSSLNLGMAIRYDDPSLLGSDRICAAIAAYSKYGGPLIVVDFGTATTYGVIDVNGDFLGGAISLGVKSTAEALHSKTAQLPSIEIQIPERAIATNTLDAIKAGTMFTAIDAVEGMVKRIRKEVGTEAKVIAAGGLSTLMATQVPIFTAVEPDLVLEGVRLIYERVARRNMAQNISA